MLGRRLGSWLLLGVMTSFVSGCFVTPEPIKPASFDKRIATDRQELFSAQEPVNPNRPISLEEAVARTLKYNLDHRVAAMEQALALGQADVSQFDLLPAVIASAGYAGRDKQKASSSRNTDTLQQSLTTSTSEDRSTKNFDLSFTWNILDFGVSYYQAHQDANRVLIAEENRRRVFQNLVADIRDAYWRAASAQRMKAEVDKVLKDVEGPIAKSREVVAKNLLPPLPILREHKNLINILSQLEALRLEADLATAKLAFLMGLERGTKFKLVDLNEDRLALPKLVIANRSAADLGPAKALSALENMALRGRSELRQELYNERIDAAETKKAMLRLLPGLEISAAHNVDTNSFLANQTWGDLGVKVTFNLFNLLKGRSNINFAETQEKVTHLRRLALNMAVLTQVNLSYRDYLASLQRLERADEVNNLDKKIHKILQAQFDNKQKGVNENDAIKAATEAVKTRLQRFKAYSDVQNSFGRIYVSIGVDMKPKKIKSNSIRDLVEALRTRFAELEAGSLGIEIPPAAAAEIKPMAPPSDTSKSPAKMPARTSGTTPAKARDAAPATVVTMDAEIGGPNPVGFAPKSSPKTAVPATAQPPAQAPAQAPTAVKASPRRGVFRVQLIAVRSKARAVREAERLNRLHRSVLGSLEIVPVQVDLGRRGIFYRLRTGRFHNRLTATTLCRQLAALNQGCIVVKS